MKPALYPDKPAHLWQHFYQISQIPRPSKHEQRVRQYIVGIAQQHNCEYRIDEVGNIVVYVAASAQSSQADTVILQNHLDMVTVKQADKNHDFNIDPLRLAVADGWLSADRTTLGADNGIGCAAALALITDPELDHPPLELLFTVDEETGLGGATDLDASMLTGKIMLNLDTEDWGELFVGCAGGKGWLLEGEVQRQAPTDNYQGYQLTLTGLAGGHSGVQIHEQLGNAVKLLGQWLEQALQLGVELISFDGGVAHNVIPREAAINFAAPPQLRPQLEQLHKSLLASWCSYLPEVDQGLQLKLDKAPIKPIITPIDSQRVLQMLLLFPHGAISYNPAQPADLVDLSINLACFTVADEGLVLETSLRYFNWAQAQALESQVLAFADNFGLTQRQTLDYPGWQPDFDSHLLQITKQQCERLFAITPKVRAIHAGLECGILKSKLPELEIISFGPTIRGAHSPSERLEIATVVPFWQLLCALLKQKLN